MKFHQRLDDFIGSQVEVSTAAGLITGTLTAVSEFTFDVETTASPGSPPETFTFAISSVGHVRIKA